MKTTHGSRSSEGSVTLNKAFSCIYKMHHSFPTPPPLLFAESLALPKDGHLLLEVLSQASRCFFSFLKQLWLHLQHMDTPRARIKTTPRCCSLSPNRLHHSRNSLVATSFSVSVACISTLCQTACGLNCLRLWPGLRKGSMHAVNASPELLGNRCARHPRGTTPRVIMGGGGSWPGQAQLTVEVLEDAWARGGRAGGLHTYGGGQPSPPQRAPGFPPPVLREQLVRPGRQSIQWLVNLTAKVACRSRTEECALAPRLRRANLVGDRVAADTGVFCRVALPCGRASSLRLTAVTLKRREVKIRCLQFI